MDETSDRDEQVENLLSYIGSEAYPKSVLASSSKDKQVQTSYVNPFYRLDKELKRRGFKKARFGKYAYEKSGQRAWISENKVLEKWSAQYSQAPTCVVSSAFQETADQAIDALISILDDHYPFKTDTNPSIAS